MKKEAILSEVETYVKDILKEWNLLGQKFYILCPCCKKQNGKPLPSGINIVGKPSSNKEGRPFDPSPSGGTYFDEVRNNQSSLTPAHKLYQGGDGAYEKVHNHHSNRAYFLSPAWGIVRSDFCLPEYNVSFSGTQEDEDPEAYVEIDSDGEYTDKAWKNGMQNAFNQLKDDIDKFGNHNIPIVLMMGLEYFWRFKYLYINSKMQNPIFVIAGHRYVVRECGTLNWSFCRPPHNGNAWYYEYMKKI